MSQGAFVTLVGYVAQEPNIRTTKNGKVVTELRVGISPRIHDKATGEWRDGESSYFSVNCWERLAHHVRASMHKGEPVLVKGRFRTETYQDKEGRIRTETRITADTVGHDLSRGIATYMRNRLQRPAAEGGQAPGDEADGQAPGSQVNGSPDLPGGPDAAPEVASDEMIDEEAIERFGRDLDDADVAARALAEDEDEAEAEEDDAPEVAASAAPF
jgi:single-strand DNA-binding protein